MRIRLERNGEVFEYEKKPMPKPRFKAMCAIACLLSYITLIAINGDGFASLLGLFLCGGVCAGILATPDNE